MLITALELWTGPSGGGILGSAPVSLAEQACWVYNLIALLTLPNWNLVELKVLDFSDRARISRWTPYKPFYLRKNVIFIEDER